MPINIGWIGGTTPDGLVSAQVFYDTTFEPVGPDQPLINDPVTGFCLVFRNLSGRNRKATFTRPDGTELVINIGQGDPVTGGPAAGRSRTVAQLNAAGYFTRGDVSLTGPE